MDVRAFLAFDLNDAVKKELEGLIELLKPKAKDVKWLKPENMHCTLKFFGNVDQNLLLDEISQEIEEIVKDQTPLDFTGIGVGVFPNWRYPRIIWAGLTGDDVDRAIDMHNFMEEKFQIFNVENDERAFRLHLTLGRAKSPIKNPEPLVALIEKLASRSFGKIHVDKLVLYKSELTKEGPIYTPLNTFPLEGKKGD